MFHGSDTSYCGCFGCSGRIGYGRFEVEHEAEDTAYGAVSQNGWPASPDPGAVDIIPFSVTTKAGKKFSFKVARQAAAKILAMIDFWDKNIEPVTQLGVYNYREIRGKEGTGKLSNHASGTAVDINWDKHPLGATGTVTADQALRITQTAAGLGMRWGGNYLGRKDEMHTEVVTGAEAAASAAAGAAQLAARKGGLPILSLVVVGGLGWLGYRELKKRGKI